MLVQAISIMGAAILLQLPSGQKLEELFWDCDYVGTTSQVDNDTAAVCSIVTDKIRAEKFNGDFTKFIEWWQSNKREQHAQRKE